MVTGDHRVEHREKFPQAEEVPRGLRRVRRLVEVGELQQRSVHEDREDQGERKREQRSAELDHEQVRPGMDLVLRDGLDVLDRTRLHDREQTLSVATGPVGTEHPTQQQEQQRWSRGDGSSGGGTAGIAAGGLGLGGLERSSRCAGIFDAASCCSALSSSAEASAGASAAALAAAALARASSARLRRCSGTSVMSFFSFLP